MDLAKDAYQELKDYFRLFDPNEIQCKMLGIKHIVKTGGGHRFSASLKPVCCN